MRLFPDPPAPPAAVAETETERLPTPLRTALSRRQVLRWGVAGGSLVILPAGLVGCGDDAEPIRGLTPTLAVTPTATPTASFLDPSERALLRAASARIVPSDTSPGALECGADGYIDTLLSIVPGPGDLAGHVFGGGPFSGRNPFPDASTGTPSDRFPADSFAHFLPLTRLQLMSWRVQLLGTAAVPGSDFNAAVIGPVLGWRQRYRDGLSGLQSKAHELFGADFTVLTAEQQDMVLAQSDTAFVDLLTQHVLEGMFCPPEYNGNTNGAGWELIGYDGDSQPLGYSIYDETAMTYRERADKPTSMANPDEDFAGVDADTARFLRFLVRLIDPPRFP